MRDAHLIRLRRGGTVFGLIVLESGVQVIFAPIVDEKAAHVRLSLGSDYFGDDFEILSKLADS